MVLPAAGPASIEQVRTDLSIDAADNRHDPAIGAVVAAVNAAVRSWPVSQHVSGEWPANVERGANMLAARLYRRRESPAGVAAFGDLGPVYVQRNDPDVALLLNLGAYAKPAVG